MGPVARERDPPVSFVRRQDGGSPCGGRGATALPFGHAGRVPLPGNGHEIVPPPPLEVAGFAVMEAGRHVGKIVNI